MKRDNPDDDHGPEATYARKRGWTVVYLDDGMLLTVPPEGTYLKPHYRPTFRTIPGAWGAAAQRAGYSPIADAKAEETKNVRPGSTSEYRSMKRRTPGGQ